jgi:hypothetical protein
MVKDATFEARHEYDRLSKVLIVIHRNQFSALT